MNVKMTLCNTEDMTIFDDAKTIKKLFISYDKVVSHSFEHIRGYFKKYLLLNGWSEKIKVEETSNMTVPAMKNKIGLGFQTGNVARFHSDMLKFQHLYKQGRIDYLIYVVPENNLATNINTNTANYERVIKELNIFGEIINLPVVVLGIANKEG